MTLPYYIVQSEIRSAFYVILFSHQLNPSEPLNIVSYSEYDFLVGMFHAKVFPYHRKLHILPKQRLH